MGIRNKRILALIIDLLIINAAISAMGVLMDHTTSLYSLITDNYKVQVKFSYEIFYYLFYFFIFDLVKQGQTIGKLATNLAVVNMDHKAPQSGELLKRTALKMLGLILLPIAALVYVLTEKSLQDSYTDLQVVRRSEGND